MMIKYARTEYLLALLLPFFPFTVWAADMVDTQQPEQLPSIVKFVTVQESTALASPLVVPIASPAVSTKKTVAKAHSAVKKPSPKPVAKVVAVVQKPSTPPSQQPATVNVANNKPVVVVKPSSKPVVKVVAVVQKPSTPQAQQPATVNVANNKPVVVVKPSPKPVVKVVAVVQKPKAAALPTKPLEDITLLATQPAVATATTETTDTADVAKIDLPTIVTAVLNNNRNLLYAKAKVAENKGDLLRSKAQFLPSISGEFSFERYDGGTIFVREQPVDVKRKTYYPKLVFDLPIPLGGATIFQVQSSKAQLKASEFAVDKTIQEQLLKAVKAYYSVQASEGKIIAAKQALQEAESNTHYQQSRMKTGVGKKLDWLQAQGTQSTQAMNLASAQTQRLLNLADLENVLARPVLGQAVVKQESTAVPQAWVSETLTLEECLKQAKINRPDLKELDAQLQEAKADLRTIKARLAPTINLGSYVGGVGPDLNNLNSVAQAGVRARVDFLNQMGVDAIAKIKMQKAKVEQKLQEIEIRISETQRSTLEAYQRVQLLRQQRQLLEAKLTANQEAYRIAKLRQNNQVGIYLEVSQTLNDLVATQTEYITTIMQYNSAQAELLLQMGQLSPAILLGLSTTAP